MEKQCISFYIYKPNDSGQYYTARIYFDGTQTDRYVIGTNSANIYADRKNTQNPLHFSITKKMKEMVTAIGKHFDGSPKSFKFGSLPIVLSREGTKYQINGQTKSLAEISDILARILYKSVFEEDPVKLMKYFMSRLDMPEAVSYVIENRLPYFFFENFRKIEVRLNVMQIDDDSCAIEIADGVWGEISFKDLTTYYNYYVLGKKRGSWKNLSPQSLYERLMGHRPKDSDVKVMIEFLKQNRQQDIVEKRALELMHDLVKQYPEKIKLTYDTDGRAVMFVRGRGYDWKLSESTYKSEIQNVSTYVWQPSHPQYDDEGNVIEVKPTWRGPICIDNMARGSSTGDQFAARALALLNDTLTVTIVSTIQRYLIAKENEYRVDFNAV
jgi:hypothetical protein